MLSAICINLDQFQILSSCNGLTLSQKTNLDSSKLKESADNNFKYDEYDESGRMFSKRVENTVGKRRNYSLRAISPFPTVFSKDLLLRQVKTRACLGKS